jgi:hypothetical protein
MKPGYTDQYRPPLSDGETAIVKPEVETSGAFTTIPGSTDSTPIYQPKVKRWGEALKRYFDVVTDARDLTRRGVPDHKQCGILARRYHLFRQRIHELIDLSSDKTDPRNKNR